MKLGVTKNRILCKGCEKGIGWDRDYLVETPSPHNIYCDECANKPDFMKMTTNDKIFFWGLGIVIICIILLIFVF